MEDKGLPDFNGKIIIVYMKNAPQGCADGVLMEYPHFVKRNDRIFLTGRVPEIDGQEWVSGTQTSVDWDSVIQYLEYKSLNDYQMRIEVYQPTLLEKLKMLFF